MTIYMKDQELPGEALNWADRDGNTIDFSTGWTFTVKVCAHGTTTVAATKSTGITGAATLPNVVIVWSALDFAALTADATYDYYVYARRTADTLDRVFRPHNPPTFTLLPAPA